VGAQGDNFIDSLNMATLKFQAARLRERPLERLSVTLTVRAAGGFIGEPCGRDQCAAERSEGVFECFEVFAVGFGKLFQCSHGLA
jgi:hypothetical protein